MRHFIALIRRLGRSALRAKHARQERQRQVDLATLVQESGMSAEELAEYKRRRIVSIDDSSKGYK